MNKKQTQLEPQITAVSGQDSVDRSSVAIKGYSLKTMVERETRNRAILTDFISHHMVKGTDYGGIMMGGRMSKDSLFKPGAEKIASLLKLRADIERDQDTWEMAGSKTGLFCYKCRLYNNAGQEVGMGLGACDLSEKKNMNTAIKIAKKRAFVDAVLTTGALSDFFTQDLEDSQESEHTATPTQESYTDESGLTHEPTDETREVRKITFKQELLIRKLADEKGYMEASICKKYGVTHLSLMNAKDASEAIEKLLAAKVNPSKEEVIDEPEIDMDEAERAIEIARSRE